MLQPIHAPRLIAAATATLLASTALTHAGGVERNAFTTSILFEQGTYVELGYAFADPDVSGVPAVGGVVVGLNSGDMIPSYGYATLSYRQDLTEALSFSFVLDQPVGADVDYAVGTGYPFQGSQAELRSTQLTAALRYELTENISVYGGLRAFQLEGQVFIDTPNFSYALDAQSDYEMGYLVGAAYEIPEIALRVALTYFSAIELGITGEEGAAPPGTPQASIPVAPTSFDVTIPQSVLLEAQSGIAEDTLLFGSIRWTEWTEFAIVPPVYTGVTGGGSLVDYDEDVWTFTLGIGRRLSDNWSVSAQVGFEAEQDYFHGNLGPVDGRTSVGLGAEYTEGPFSIAFGVQYAWIGDAETFIDPTVAPPVTGDFNDNTAIAAGIRIGYQF